MQAETLAAALAAALTRSGDDKPAAQLARLSIEHLLDRPLLEVIDTTDVADAIVAWLAGDGPGTLLSTHVSSVVDSEKLRSGRSDELLAEYVPPKVVTEVTARLARPWDLPAGWADGVVDPAFVRAVLADALADVLEDFVSSLPLAGVAGSLIGSITRKAGRITGSSVPFAGQAREFGAGAAERLRKQILDEVHAEHNADELRATLDRASAAVLGLRTADGLALLDDPGIEVTAEWMRDLLSHNLGRAEIADTVRTQIIAGLQREAGIAPTLGAWLERLDLTDTVTTGAVSVLATRIRALASGDSFERWLTVWLSDAMSALQE